MTAIALSRPGGRLCCRRRGRDEQSSGSDARDAHQRAVQSHGERPPVLVSLVYDALRGRRARRIVRAVSASAPSSSALPIRESRWAAPTPSTFWRPSVPVDREPGLAAGRSSSPCRLRLGARHQHDIGLGGATRANDALGSGASPAARPRIPLPTSFTTLEDILHLPLQTRREQGRDVHGSMARLQRRPGTRPLSCLCERHLASDSPPDRERRTRLVVRTPRAQPRPHQAGVADAPPGTGRLESSRRAARHVCSDAGIGVERHADGKTIVRGGAGRYFDPAVSTNFNNLAAERQYLSPLGVGRISVPPARLGLEFLQMPTAFTAAQFLAMLPALRAELLKTRNPDNRDFSIRNIDLEKRGQNLYDPSYQMPYAIHVGAGVERELTRNFVVSADVDLEAVRAHLHQRDRLQPLGQCRRAGDSPVRRRAEHRPRRLSVRMAISFSTPRSDARVTPDCWSVPTVVFRDGRSSSPRMRSAATSGRTAPAPARAKPAEDARSDSTTTTGSTTTDRCRPTTVTC